MRSSFSIRCCLLFLQQWRWSFHSSESTQLVSRWQADGIWGTVECVDDMTESPYVGSGHSNPRQVHFPDLFGGLRAERLIPASMS
jgi:hypothetical protein